MEKIQKLECIDTLAKIKPEIESEFKKISGYCDNVARHVIDSMQILYTSKSLELTPSMKRMKEQNEHYHFELMKSENDTLLSKRYWPERQENETK